MQATDVQNHISILEANESWQVERKAARAFRHYNEVSFMPETSLAAASYAR